MSVGTSKVTDKQVTTTGEIRPVAIQTIKGGSSKAMTKEVSKATIPTGNHKDRNKTGEIIISRHKTVATITSRRKTGAIATSLRKEDKAIQEAPNKIILTSNEATGPKAGHHKGLRKTGVVSNHGRKEEMTQNNS